MFLLPLLTIEHFQHRTAEKAMATHSSAPAWKIPWTEEPGRLQSMGSRKVGHDWATSLSLFTFIHWRRRWQATPVFLSGESQGQGSLVGCRLWGRAKSDTTEWVHFHFSLSCIGEGNGNPLQCSCLENPRDGGAWWAAVYVVAQSRTRLKRLNSSNSSSIELTSFSHSCFKNQYLIYFNESLNLLQLILIYFSRLKIWRIKKWSSPSANPDTLFWEMLY